jgi:hypothetical protein
MLLQIILIENVVVDVFYLPLEFIILHFLLGQKLIKLLVKSIKHYRSLYVKELIYVMQEELISEA